MRYPFTSKLEKHPERSRAASARNGSKIYLETWEYGDLGNAVLNELGLQSGLPTRTPASAVQIHIEVARTCVDPEHTWTGFKKAGWWPAQCVHAA